MTNLPTQTEPAHKIAQIIAKATVRHMSDTKWRKLFALLHELPGGCETIGLKLIGRKVLGTPPPGPFFEEETCFGGQGDLKSVPFAHIEYVGLSNSVVANADLLAFLSKHGQWPIVEEDEGILIIGYEWGRS